MAEIPPTVKRDSQEPTEAERIVDRKNRLARRLRRVFIDEPDMLAVLESDVDTSHRVPTFDPTENGGLNMSREWGNTLSKFGDGYILKIQPPVGVEGVAQEAIHAFAGQRPYYDVVIEKAGQRAVTYTFGKGSVAQSEKIMSRLEQQMSLKRKVVSQSD
jgi:hypothetical protein